MEYKNLIIQGVSWLGFFRVVTRIISFGRVILLARILAPAQFGAFGVAQLVLTCLDILTETGINVILIQEKEKIDKYIDSAWVVSIARGFLMGLLLFILAPYIASFFNSPESLGLIRLMGIVPIIKGFINPSIVNYQKELQFKNEFWLRTTIFIVDSVTAVIVTFITGNASGIIYGLMAGAITEVILSFIFIKPYPKFAIQKDYIQKILQRGKWITASGIFTYLFQNGDNIVVGRLLGTSSLGLYQMAYSLSILPISEVTDVFSKVAFPFYTKIADDYTKLKTAFYKIALLTAVLTIPISIVLFIFPEQIITVLLGEKWIAVAPVLRILSIFGLIRSVFISAFPLFLAVGKQQYITVVTLVSILGLGITIIPLINQFGLVGAAYSVIVGSLISIPVIIYYTLKILNK